MSKIPFVDMKRMHESIHDELRNAAVSVLDSGHYIGGPEIKSFEKEMAEHLGVSEVCGVSCATLGLYSTLKSLGVGEGDEVITTVHTAIATAEAISLTGAQVVFSDLKPGWFFLDPEQVEKKITDKTKAIIPVHLYGQPVDIDAFLALGEKYNLKIIEDCAQAQGACYKGKQVGGFGDAGVFSFFPSKNLGGFGDGGAVTARDPEVMKKVRMFSNHGRTKKYWHEFEGINSRLDAMQAAMLRVCLPQLDGWNAARRKAAEWYDAGLADITDLKTPSILPETDPVYHVYVILVPDRDRLMEFLKEKEIATGIHYPYALNMLPAYAYLNEGEGFYPEAEYDCAHMLSLPMHPSITEKEVKTVCDAIHEFFNQ